MDSAVGGGWYSYLVVSWWCSCSSSCWFVLEDWTASRRRRRRRRRTRRSTVQYRCVLRVAAAVGTKHTPFFSILDYSLWFVTLTIPSIMEIYLLSSQTLEGLEKRTTTRKARTGERTTIRCLCLSLCVSGMGAVHRVARTIYATHSIYATNKKESPL